MIEALDKFCQLLLLADLFYRKVYEFLKNTFYCGIILVVQ